jgi:GT2 family glycosyltransferase
MPEPIPVVILQYGKFELTEECIRSLRRQAVPVQIWLVDGNSPGKDEPTLAALAGLSDHAIFLDKNLGYAAANNVAIREILKTEAPYFMVINNDTAVSPTCMEELRKCLDENPSCAQACLQVRYPNGALQSAGGTIKYPLFEPQLIGHLAKAGSFQTAGTVTYAPGVAVLVRSAAAQAVGLIPERYFMYAEDVDWSLEFAKAGWDIRYCPAAVITHHDSASMGSFSGKKGFYMIRSNVWLAKKWCTPPEWKKFKRLMWQKLARQSVKYARHPAYVRGMWEGYGAGTREGYGAGTREDG